MVFVANKCDLVKDRLVSTTEGAELARSYGVPFVETSAKSRVNVEEAFIQCVREIKKWRQRLEANARDSLEDSPKKMKSQKCIIL
jgi:GTPase KRas protein